MLYRKERCTQGSIPIRYHGVKTFIDHHPASMSDLDVKEADGKESDGSIDNANTWLSDHGKFCFC